jgi:Leucine-rich repeat (LRR) protein
LRGDATVAERPVRFRIGKYEFREQDHRQITFWAQETGKTPEELVSLLAAEDDGKALVVEDGAIIQLAFPKKPIFPQRILQISELPKLVKLRCSDNELTAIEFCTSSGLEELNCDNNRLTKLDLSNVPALTKLSCSQNQFTELDLSNVPELTRLSCVDNQLAKLDVRGNPNLRAIVCDHSVKIIKCEWQSFPDKILKIHTLRVVPTNS